MSVDCSPYKTNAACDAIVCNTDWTKTDTAPAQRNGFCKTLTGSFAVCGNFCGGTKWGNDCCTASDWQTCFTNLSKNSCANGGSNGMAGQTHALGSTSIISTVSGHTLQTNGTSTAFVSTATSSRSSAAQTSGSSMVSGSASASSHSSSTTSSSPAATSKSAAERSMSLGSKLTVFVLVAGVFANPIFQCLL